MSVVTYDVLTGDQPPHFINYTANAGASNLYPDSNSIAVLGPVYLPRVYGSNLTAFEIASSGKVALTLNDIHTMDFTRSNWINNSTYQNTLDSSNNTLNMIANYGGATGLQLQLDAFSNNLNEYAASNINLSTGTGNISLIAASNILFSPSNNFAVSALSNIFFAAQQGSFGYTANNNAMFMTLCNTNNNTTMFSSNNIFQIASNNAIMTAQSNINLNASYGDFKANAGNGQMYTNMSAATNTTSNYSLCNYGISTSNQFNLSALSNINLATSTGDLKLFSTGCNMRLTMCNLNNNINLYTASNLFFTSCNNSAYNVYSNLNIGTTAGDINMSANTSNIYINMSTSNGSNSLYQYAASNMQFTACNQMTLNANSNFMISTLLNLTNFANNNYIIGASNQYNLNSKSNISMGTTIGDVALSANASNVYQTLQASTNNFIVFASNNISNSACNNWTLNTNSNVNLSANNGDMKLFSTGSNMRITMCNLTQKIRIFSSNDSVFDSSNNYYISSLSNMTLAALSGDVKLYANSSNTSIVMSNLATSITIFAQSNINFLSSNNYNLTTLSNINISAINGAFNLYSSNDTSNTACNSWSLNACKNVAVSANNNAMTFNMYANSNNVRLNTSNSFFVSASNSQIFTTNSNTSFCNISGSFSIQANNSNMTLLMDSTANSISHYASNNYNVNTSNNINLAANSGDLKLFSTGCNMRITLCNATQKVRIFSSNDSAFDSSNNFYISSLSNMALGALSGSWGAYSTGCNMFLTMTQATSNVFLYASNNTEISASNNLIHNARSNLTLNASKGSLGLYGNNSNMSITFCNITNTINVISSGNYSESIAASWSNVTGNNISFNSLSNNFSVYATSNINLNVDTSNVYINLNGSSNPDTIDIYAKSNINMVTTNSFNTNIGQFYNLSTSNFTVNSAYNLNLNALNNVNIAANSNLTFSMNSLSNYTVGDQSYSACNNINFYVRSTVLDPVDPVFSIGSGLVKVNGDMLIAGNINTCNIYSTSVVQQTLKISDKTVNLASAGSNDLVTGGQADGLATNDQSGIYIDGVPSIIAGSNYSPCNAYLIPSYQKSMLWNYGTGNGVLDVGTSNATTEAYWELLGGSLHITKKKVLPPVTGCNTSNLQNVTFGLRINDLDELEIIKTFIPTGCNVYVTRRLARFGRII